MKSPHIFTLLVISLSTIMTQSAVAKTADNVYAITESLITPINSKTSWNWSIIDGDESYKYNSNSYGKSHQISEEKSIEGMGTRSTPYLIKFQSSNNSYVGEGNHKFWKLSQIVNPKNLTKMKSNCNFKDVSVSEGEDETEGASGGTLQSQMFYKWSRKGKKPLYIAESIGNGYVITSVFNSYQWQNYTIVNNPKYFSKADIWDTDENGKKVKCHYK